jgi:ketosteroid isomerase-like protein
MKRMLLIPILAVLTLTLALGQEPAEKKSPGKGKGAGSGTIKQQIKDLEKQWTDALLKHDAGALGRIWADDVIEIDFTGQVRTKAEDLADLKSGEPKFESLSIEDMKVGVFGNVAVVNGHYTQKGTYKGRDISHEGRYTDVFVKFQGRWQCVSTQATPITKQ